MEAEVYILSGLGVNEQGEVWGCTLFSHQTIRKVRPTPGRLPEEPVPILLFSFQHLPVP